VVRFAVFRRHAAGRVFSVYEDRSRTVLCERRRLSDGGWICPGKRASPDRIRAAAWLGSSRANANLQTYLPSGYAGSGAQGTDEKGNIVGVAIDGAGVLRAIIWVKH
jgi:hypothetical protein